MIARLLIIVSLVLVAAMLHGSATASIDAHEIAEIVEVCELEVQLPAETIDLGHRASAAPPAACDQPLPGSVELPSVFRPPRSAFV